MAFKSEIRGSYGILGNLGGISPQAVNPLMTRDNNIIFGQILPRILLTMQLHALIRI
jgi:hypothetical protein